MKQPSYSRRLSTRLQSSIVTIIRVTIVYLILFVLTPAAMFPSAAHALSPYRYTKVADATNGYAYGGATATDNNGNVYVAGQWQGTVIFDGVGGSDSRTTNASSDAYLTKYDANGNYVWTKTFDANNSGANAYAYSVATDSTGNVFITGDWHGTIIFDGPGGSDSRSSSSSSNSFLTEYSSAGTYEGTKVFDTSVSGSDAYPNSVTVDSNGNVFTAGFWLGTVVFDGVGGSDSKTASNFDSYLTKYNANGSYAWTKTFDANAAGAGAAVNGSTTDKNNNIYLTGTWNGTVVFDGPGGSDSRTTSATSNAFITKYNANGSYAWTKTFDANAAGAQAGGYSVATDANANIYVTGDWNGTVVFDGPGGSDSQNNGNLDTFLTKYNANGSYAWTKTFDSSASTSYGYGIGVGVDSSNNVYMTGQWDGTVVFDGPGGSDSQTTPNSSAYLTTYAANGTYVSTAVFDSSAHGSFSGSIGLAVDKNSNDIYITGQWDGTVVFDGPGGSDSQTINSAVGANSFLTSFHGYSANSPNPPPSGGTTSNSGVKGTGVKAPNTGLGTYTINDSASLPLVLISADIICVGAYYFSRNRLTIYRVRK